MPASNDDESGVYYRPRDTDETIRLNAQHYAIVLRTGWLLHPQIEESISKVKEPQIADVACGSGVWTFEVAEKFPATFVTGLDVSTKQFPPEVSWSTNSRLETLDLTQETPPHYCGKFDVVHCRFLLAAGPAVDPKRFADAFFKLLKPGGWLQWQELAYPTSVTFEPIRDSTGTIKEYREIPLGTEGVAKAGHIEYKCAPASRFENWMRENTSFQDVQEIDMPPTPQHGRLETNVLCRALSTAANLMLNLPGLDEATKDQLREDIATAEKLELTGALCAFRLGLCIARAPSN